MIKNIQIFVNPIDYNKYPLEKIVSSNIKISENRIKHIQILKRSIDARKADIKIVLQLQIYIDENPEIQENKQFFFLKGKKKGSVIIVGMGPAGLFAALRLLMYGVKPIIVEQGKNVSERKKDIALMYRTNVVNESSNYCFGEGGAGTFSDGKLYTRSQKKGDIKWFLNVLCNTGASQNILIDSHPHIGSDKLPSIVKNIRNLILESGGEIYFSTRVTDLIIENDICKGVEIDNNDKIYADAVILASGHSSKKIYEIFFKKDIKFELKGFAIGVRIEHSQQLINYIQYHGSKFLNYLPPAEYRIVEQIDGRGVYSFCMCPGGFIIPSMTEQQTIVVNGMSASKRNSPFANSGFVVEIHPEDILQSFNCSDILSFQYNLEHTAYRAVNNGLKAPAQRITDFIDNKISVSLPETSYLPGIVSSPMHEWLPSFLSSKLKSAFLKIRKKMPNFISEDAIMVGIESRTSSPIRITRNSNSLEHVQIKNLFPCGEGAGYAGGITSSALDGINVAEAIVASKF
jgi:hypothetical protein